MKDCLQFLSFAAMICLFVVKAIECARLLYGRFFRRPVYWLNFFIWVVNALQNRAVL